jgi:hypothetical protein
MAMCPHLTMNLIEIAPEDWEGCDHLDCLPYCWPNEYHCERLYQFMEERGIPRQPFKPEIEEERRQADEAESLRLNSPSTEPSNSK